jgi:twitching motility protein PilT
MARVIAERDAHFAERLSTALAEREAAFAAQLAAVVADRDSDVATQIATAVAWREQELSAAAAADAARREEQLAATFAAERSRLEADLSERIAAVARLTERSAMLEAELAQHASAAADFTEHAARLEAAFATRLEEVEARAAERESALNAAFEARLADTIAEADERVQAIEQSLTLEAQARAEAEAAALADVEAEALRAELARAALEAALQSERAAAPAAAAADSGSLASPAAEEPARTAASAAPVQEDTRPFIVLPRYAAVHSSTGVLLDVLRDGLERGASAVYAIGGSRPLLRIEGDITSPPSFPVLQAADIDRFAFEFAPRDEVAHSTSEWTTLVPDVGSVRCVSFEDAAGRGLVFHLAANVSSADELGLSREVQALCNEPDGLIVLAGPRASGKSTLLSAFVDRINRSRSDHVITIESRVRTLHERRHSLISQREVDGEGTDIARAARAALREGPDVLVMDDARSPEAIVVAVDAARAGRLVFLSMPAPSTTAAIERLTDAFSVDRRPQVRALLSGALRAVIYQVLVNRVSGGRIAAREVLLSSPQVKQLILEGAFAQVPIAIEGGRRLGMSTLTDSLVSLVREGSVGPAEALRHAPNRRVMIAALREEGIDVSEFERRA